MSTCHEVVVARQSNLKVVGFSIVSDASHLDSVVHEEINHQTVIEIAKKSTESLSKLICNFIQNL